MAEVILDIGAATELDVAEGLKLLQKKRADAVKMAEKRARGEVKSYAKKWSEMTPEQKAKALAQSRKFSTRQRLLARKATEAGITVSDDEIDAAIATTHNGEEDEE